MAKLLERRGLPAPRGPWTSVLVEMAAVNRDDGGAGLQQFAQRTGLTHEPSVTIIVKRPPRAKALDPQVEDVLDALRALCA